METSVIKLLLSYLIQTHEAVGSAAYLGHSKNSGCHHHSPHALPPHSVLQRVPPFHTYFLSGAAGYLLQCLGPHLPVCLLALRWELCLNV